MNRLKTFLVEVCHQQRQFIKVKSHSRQGAKELILSNRFDFDDASEMMPDEPRIITIKEEKCR